jgi:hypothetical protein
LLLIIGYSIKVYGVYLYEEVVEPESFVVAFEAVARQAQFYICNQGDPSKQVHFEHYPILTLEHQKASKFEELLLQTRHIESAIVSNARAIGSCYL